MHLRRAGPREIALWLEHNFPWSPRSSEALVPVVRHIERQAAVRSPSQGTPRCTPERQVPRPPADAEGLAAVWL